MLDNVFKIFNSYFSGSFCLQILKIHFMFQPVGKLMVNPNIQVSYQRFCFTILLLWKKVLAIILHFNIVLVVIYNIEFGMSGCWMDVCGKSKATLILYWKHDASHVRNSLQSFAEMSLPTIRQGVGLILPLKLSLMSLLIEAWLDSPM